MKCYSPRGCAVTFQQVPDATSRKQQTTEPPCATPPRGLDALNIHPSIRWRIQHYLEARPAPYIG